MTLDELNRVDRAVFVEIIGWVFEDSPWVAERAWVQRPFASIEALASALGGELRRASRDEQLALFRAHPDLGARAKMSQASSQEQAGAGLDRLSASEFSHLTTLNQSYRDRFGFPFLFAVKGATARQIIESLERRLTAPVEAEWNEALQQVERIARSRLSDVVR